MYPGICIYSGITCTYSGIHVCIQKLAYIFRDYMFIFRNFCAGKKRPPRQAACSSEPVICGGAWLISYGRGLKFGIGGWSLEFCVVG